MTDDVERDWKIEGPEDGKEPLTALSDQDRKRIESFRAQHATELLVILFTDLVGSAALKSELGDQAYKSLDDEHKRILLSVIDKFKKAQTIRVEGDSYIFVFLKPSDAVRFALTAQALHRKARAGDMSRLPEFRVGIHLGTVVVEEGLKGPEEPGGIGDIKGLQADMTARVMGLAKGGQILCSRAVFDDARQALKGTELEEIGTLVWQSHGPYILKGREDPLEICEVGEEGIAPLEKPEGNEKARPADISDEELGWRPAIDVMVPGTDWRLEKKLGEGEFGEVWLGRNTGSSEQQVYKFCFKRERVAWLKREARLLTELKKRLPGHPNIVSFRDVMTESDRPPYYITMEYVDGPSIEEWLTTSPELRERFEIVAQIADGLDAVHREKIYHRDVKPTNILLAKQPDGSMQAKLSDFGLGTAEDPDLLKSVYASRVNGLAGTWDYIAPEVREGNPASAQSDIYALGLTLYQLLIGDLKHPMVSGWEREIESEILAGDIARCTDTDAKQRWTRAHDLADALRHHDQRLNELQLKREREEHKRRARRFQIIAGLSSLFAIVTLGFGGYAWYQRGEARHQRTEAEIQAKIAKMERDTAQDQRDRAIKQKQLALEAVNKLTYDLPERLKDVSGTLSVLREIMEENVAMLDKILELEPDTPEAHREKWSNLVGIGNRWLLLGDTMKALETYESAFEIAKDLHTSQPNDPFANEDLALSVEKLADVYALLGRTDEALQNFNRCLEIRKKLSLSDPENDDAQSLLAWSYTTLGNAYLNLGRNKEALEAYQSSFEISKSRAEAQPDNEEVQKGLVPIYTSLGDAYLALGRTDDALKAYESAFSTILVSEFGELERLWLLTRGYNCLGDVYFKLGDTENALESYKSSLNISWEIADSDPDNMSAQRNLSVVYNKIGDLYLDLGLTEEALETYEAMMENNKRLADYDPASVLAKRDLAVSYNRVADVYFDLGRTDEAQGLYETSLEIAKELAKNPENLTAQADLAISLNRLGDLYLHIGLLDEAFQAHKSSIDIVIAVAEAEPENPVTQRNLAVSWNRLGDTYFQKNLIDEALEAYESALEVATKITTRYPESRLAQQDAVFTYNKIGDAQLSLGRPENATESFEEGLEIAKNLVETDPEDTLAQRDLSISYNRIGDAYYQLRSAEKAFEAYDAAFEIAKRLDESQPGNVLAQRDLTLCCNKTGDVHLALGRNRAALGQYWIMNEVTKDIAESDPESWAAATDLMLSYSRVGDAYLADGLKEQAAKNYTEAHIISSGYKPVGIQKTMLISWGYYRLDELYFHFGFYEEALTAHLSLIQLLKELISEPMSMITEWELEWAYMRLGELQLYLRRHEEALETYAVMITTLVDLAEAEPGSLTPQGDLIGIQQQYRNAMKKIGPLITENPEQMEWRHVSAVYHFKNGKLLEALGELEGAAGEHKSAKRTMQKLLEHDNDNALWRKTLAMIENNTVTPTEHQEEETE